MAKTEVADEVVDAPAKKLKPLSEKDIRLRECAGNVWRVIAPPGVDRAALLEPSLWAVIANRLRAFDEITVIASDRTYHCRLLCLQAGLGYAEFIELTYTPLPAQLSAVGETLPSNHKLIFDVQAGWSAIRISDGVPIVRNCDSQQECLKLLLAHASLKE